jgi:hypothetical protein
MESHFQIPYYFERYRKTFTRQFMASYGHLDLLGIYNLVIEKPSILRKPIEYEIPYS